MFRRTQEVELIPSPQDAQGTQLFESTARIQERRLDQALAQSQFSHSGDSHSKIPSPAMEYVELIPSPQHAQGTKLVESPAAMLLAQCDEALVKSQLLHFENLHTIAPSQAMQEVELIPPRHTQRAQLVESPPDIQEIQLDQALPQSQFLHFENWHTIVPSNVMHEVELITTPQHAQGIQLVELPAHVLLKQLDEAFAYSRFLHIQNSHTIVPSQAMQEVELIPSPQHAQGTQLVEPLAHIQETEPLSSPTHMKEITEYLIAHQLWQVPDSVIYEEPTAETQCDLETCLEETVNDATDAAARVQRLSAKFRKDLKAPSPVDRGSVGIHTYFAEENQEINYLNPEDGVEVKVRKRGGRRHKGHFMKRPMALSEVIEELKNNDLRENALRCLSGHLVERREQDPDFYRQAGFYIFHSCSTIVILIQEILFVYERFYAEDLNVRRSKRLANVLCLLQCVATNDETRLPLVKARIPNFLIPFIKSDYTDEVYENIRSLSLSVISILCQALQKEVIHWALDSDIVEVCFHALDVGSELSKVLAMTVMDSILRVDEGLYAVCDPSCELLPRFIRLCEDLVAILAFIRGFSPRLIFLVVRSFILLCRDRRAVELLKEELPIQLQDTTFCDLKIEYPLFAYLRHLLLLCTGKATDYLPSVGPSPVTPSSTSSASMNGEDTKSSNSGQTRNKSVLACVTPMRPVDLNKQDWSSSASVMLQT